MNPYRLLLSFLLLAILSCETHAVPPESFFPLGVYWPWETTSQLGQGAERAAKLDKFLADRLDQLAAHGVNTVWTVNGPDSAEELGTLCHLAEQRKIRIIAGSGWWAMHAGNANDQWIPTAVAYLQKTCKALEGKPRPMAFTIADEPTGKYLDVFGRYAAAVKAAGIPATTTVMHGDIEGAAAKAPTLPWLCVDFYPFFGSTHGPRGDASYHWFQGIARRIVRAAAPNRQAPWVMAQAYQEIWGPGRIETNGFATVLPGGGQHWLMPTPEQIRWQAWTAAASGAKGIFFFTYGVTSLPNPKAEPIKDVWAVRKETATGGPMSLVSYPDFRPGPQMEAMGKVFAEIRTIGADLLRLETADQEHQFLVRAQEPPIAGDLLNLLVDPASGTLYAAVVASPKRAGRPITLRLSPKVVRLVPLGGAPSPQSPAAQPGADPMGAVPLQPGQGAFYRLEIQTPVKHRLLAVDNHRNRLLHLDECRPARSWAVDVPPGARDLQLLGGEKVLISHGKGAAEYDLATGRRLTWGVDRYSEILTAQRLASGNTFLAANTAAGVAVYEVDRDGKEVGRRLLQGLKDLRLLRPIENGNLLLTVSGPYRVIEVDRQGKIVWQAPLPDKGYKAVRLANGNTMATTGGTVTVVEFDPSGKAVFTAGGKAAYPKLGLDWFSGFDPLPSGNVVVANWLGHGKLGQGPHLVEFDRKNGLVWKWEDHRLAGTITNVLVLE